MKKKHLKECITKMRTEQEIRKYLQSWQKALVDCDIELQKKLQFTIETLKWVLNDAK